MNTAAPQCPRCGESIRSTMVEGLCTRCLFALLEEPPPVEGMGAELGGRTLDSNSAMDGIGKNESEFGDYELLEEIGQGGMGVVHRARQMSLNRPVAVKVIKLGMDTRSVIARFEAERQALALMDHPGIARVIDAGATSAGRPYFVMELVRGEKITDYCRKRNLSTNQKLELFVKVCQAVQHAHQKGIIHRDLKPSNILVTELDGQPLPKIIDFGIAKAIEGRLADQTLFTVVGQFVGTPAYLSPEQAELGGVDIDTRSDIYSLGVLLYELLTGCLPFEPKELARAGLEEMRRTVRDVTPVRPSTRLRRSGAYSRLGTYCSTRHQPLATDLDWIVMKCLEKDRARRYETANGLAMDIQRHLNKEPIVARPPSRIYEFQKTVQRHWIGFAATSAVIAALCAGVVISLWQAGAANSAKNEAFAAVRKANERLHESLLSQARASRLSGQPHSARESIKAAAQLKPTSETRDEAIAALAMSGLGKVRTWFDLPLTYEFPAFSDDLTLFAHADQGVLIVRRTSDWAETARFETPGEKVGHLDLSKDGRYLAALGRGGHGWLFNAQNPGKVFRCRIQESHGYAWIGFGPEGRILAVADEFPRLRVFSVPSGELLSTVAVGPSREAQFHPDGKQIAVASESEVKVIEWSTGEVLQRREFPASVRGLSWHPGGTGLAVSLDTDDILLWNFAPDGISSVPARGSSYRISFSQRGDMMMSGANPTQLWSVGPIRLLSSTLGGVGMKLGSDDSSLAFSRSSFGAGVWEVVRSKVCYTVSSLADKANNGGGLVFSADGRYLGSTTETEFQIWDWRRNRMIVAKPAKRAHALIFHPFEPVLLVTSFDGVHRYRLRFAQDGSLKGVDAGEALENLPMDRYYRSSITANGNLLAIANPATTLVYDLSRHEVVRRLDTKDVTEVKISPDGRKLVTSTYRGDGSRVWNVATGTEILRISQEDGHANFSTDGRWLAFSTAKRLDVWDASGWTRALSREFSSETVTGGGNVVFSPDGRFLALIDMHLPALLLNPKTGEEVGRLTLPIPIRSHSAAFSASSSLLALDGPDGTCVWDLARLEKELLGWGLNWGQLEQSGSSGHGP